MNDLSPMGDADLGTLKYEDDHGVYFELLRVATSRFASVYEDAQSNDNPDESSFEAIAFKELTGKLLTTAAVLKLRYVYRGKLDRPLYVDLSDSGFPNFQEISKLETEQGSAKERLATLPAMPALKRSLIDAIMKGDDSPQEALAALSERAYFSALDSEELFLRFTNGPLKQIGERAGRRIYAHACGSYDPSSNLPIIYVGIVEQEFNEEPLEHRGMAYEQFIEKMKAECSHASPLAFMAMSIDELPTISPKWLKRLTVGPLYSPLLFEAREDVLSEREKIIDALCQTAVGQDSFMLCANDEIIVSNREERAKTTFLGGLSGAKTVRQVFYLPENDLELYRRKASLMHRYALMPHPLVQELSPDIRAAVPELAADTILLPFTMKGEINVIGQRASERTTD